MPSPAPAGKKKKKKKAKKKAKAKEAKKAEETSGPASDARGGAANDVGPASDARGGAANDAKSDSDESSDEAPARSSKAQSPTPPPAEPSTDDAESDDWVDVSAARRGKGAAAERVEAAAPPKRPEGVIRHTVNDHYGFIRADDERLGDSVFFLFSQLGARPSDRSATVGERVAFDLGEWKGASWRRTSRSSRRRRRSGRAAAAARGRAAAAAAAGRRARAPPRAAARRGRSSVEAILARYRPRRPSRAPTRRKARTPTTRWSSRSSRRSALELPSALPIAGDRRQRLGLEAGDLSDIGVAPGAAARILAAIAAARLVQRRAPPRAADAAAADAAVDDSTRRVAELELAEPPDDLLCPISFEIMKDPVMADDGNTYEPVCKSTTGLAKLL
ncbi:ubiquitin-protein transferase [Aureococcus anophagefferens]|nr:ubiquitin-protein transferase [Aureococcus anophagefferens]